MANHKNFPIATDVQVYFCDPRSRGSAAATTGLTAGCVQYFPKGMDLSDHSESCFNKIALR